MKLLDRFLSNKKSTAQIAKERLQIIVAHESMRRKAGKERINIQELKEKLIVVIADYLKIDRHQVENRINVELDHDRSILELDVTLPEENL